MKWVNIYGDDESQSRYICKEINWMVSENGKQKSPAITKDLSCNKVIYQFSRSGGRIGICWQHWEHTF